MSNKDLLTQAQRKLRALSPERLRVANDFLAYLEEREDNEATRELLAIPGFTKSLEKAERQATQGHTHRLSDIRRNV